jgi:hypothetical protein
MGEQEKEEKPDLPTRGMEVGSPAMSKRRLSSMITSPRPWVEGCLGTMASIGKISTLILAMEGIVDPFMEEEMQQGINQTRT